MHKSNICGTDFVRYLHDLGKKYRLSEFGSVTGMDHYGIISKDTREKQLLRIRQHVNQREPKGKKQPINAHSSEFTGNKLVELARESIPNNLDTPFSSLWNMDLAECLEPFHFNELPEELTPTSSEVITIEGK